MVVPRNVIRVIITEGASDELSKEKRHIKSKKISTTLVCLISVLGVISVLGGKFFKSLDQTSVLRENFLIKCIDKGFFVKEKA